MADDSDEQLEQRVEQLEQQLSKMLPGRRGVLKGLGAAALGGAAVGGATGGASGQSAAGQIGTPDDRVDVFANNYDVAGDTVFDSVNTGQVSSNVAAQRAEYYIRDAGANGFEVILTSDKSVKQTDSSVQTAIQYAIDNLSSSYSIELGEMDAVADSSIDISGVNDLTIRGQGPKTVIRAGGAITLFDGDAGAGNTDSNTLISDVNLNGNGNSATLIRLNRVGRPTLRNIELRNADVGLQADETYAFEFTNLYAKDNSVTGFDSDYGLNEGVFTRCAASSCDFGFKLSHDGTGENPRGLVLLQCSSVNAGTRGIDIAGWLGGRIIQPYIEGSPGVTMFDDSNGVNCQSVSVEGGWYLDTDRAIDMRQAERCYQSGAFVEAKNTTISDAIRFGFGAADCSMDYGSNSFKEDGGTITNEVTDDGTRSRDRRIIGGGVLGGADLSSVTGQFDGDLAVADGSSAAAADAWARWDASGSAWDYTDPTGSV